jgi:hypothetical protein
MDRFLFEHASYPLAGGLVVLAVAAWVVMIRAATSGRAKTAIAAGLVTVLAAPAFTATLMMVGPKHQIEQRRVEFQAYLDDTYGTPEEQAAKDRALDQHMTDLMAAQEVEWERTHRRIDKVLTTYARRIDVPLWVVDPGTKPPAYLSDQEVDRAFDRAVRRQEQRHVDRIEAVRAMLNAPETAR